MKQVDLEEQRIEQQRIDAAAEALALVEPGMRLGLGTGRTAAHFVRQLGAAVRAGLRVEAVPTSEQTAELARREGIPLVTLDSAVPALDLAVDGADEVDRHLRLVKGGGGALLREKIVAAAAARMIVLVDERKVVETLGAFPLAVEVVPFGASATRRRIEAEVAKIGLGGAVVLRRAEGGEPFVTDGGHFVFDASFGRIPDPEELARALDGITGVVEHGLFLGIASVVLVGRTRLDPAS